MKYCARIPLLLAPLLAGWSILELPGFVPQAGAQGTSIGSLPENAVFAQGRGRRGRGNRGDQAQATEGGNTEQAQPGGDGQGAGFGQRGGGFGRGRGRRGGGENAAAGRGPGGFLGTTATDPRGQAREIIQQNDRNGDGLLQTDESRVLRRFFNADSNNDDVITQDELTTALTNMQMARGGPAAGARGTSENSSESGERGNRRGGRGSDENTDNDRNNNNRDNNERGNSNRDNNNNDRSENDRNRNEEGNRRGRGRGGANEAPVAQTLLSLLTERRSYVLSPAQQQLPKEGLPSWFASRDANGDGQVAMSEYDSNWNEQKVAAFLRIDLNRDFIITADEALKSN